MWNDPDLDDNRTQSYSDTRNRRNNKSNNRQEEEKKEEISAFGYESFFFHNDGTSEAIEQGQLHITWQGQDPQDENALWLDRYDVRNLLDDERLFTGSRDIHNDKFLHEIPDLFHDRFQDLDSDEELLFHMDEDEREEHLAQKRDVEPTSDYKGVQFNYDHDKDEDEPIPTYNIHFEVPEGMIVPDSEKTLALIERTAKFVNSSSEPTMEIILQAKQATNPNFAFMSRRHHLYQFYKHVRRLMQMGLYETAEEAKQREEEEAEEAEEAEMEEKTRRAQKALKAEE
ncbi:hypothetical protein BGZ76_005678 [Entomortierella beljakovae]|nr:hypothetical protein BGZ76_005678 [Entomortierella beljakovae]